MSCECVPQPPVLDFGPPPDPSLVWHLLTDEPYEKFEDCEWNPFISITDVSSGSHSNTAEFDRLPLLLCALAACLLLCVLCTLFAVRLKRRNNAEKNKQKTASSDHILTAADNLWSYNSMKTSNSHQGSMGVLMYGSSQNGGSMVFHKTVTPGSIRAFRPGDSVMRQSSTMLRLHPDQGNYGNYHTVGRHYEEIPSRLAAQLVAAAPQSQMTPDRWATPPRASIRKPPPSCRPPPPPQDDYVVPNDLRQSKFHSPGASDSSTDHELAGIPSDSPPMKRWDDPENRSRLSGENGRESGYGTAPSRQWRSPPNSGGRPSEVPLPPGLVLTHNPDAHSMTYV